MAGSFKYFVKSLFGISSSESLDIKTLPIASEVVYKATHSVSHEVLRPLISCKLAASYGELKKYLKDVDDTLLVAIGTSVTLLNKLESRDWESALSCMVNNPALQSLGDPIYNTKMMNTQTSKWFNYGLKEAPADSKAVKEAVIWINELINDSDVIDALSFEPITLAKFVNLTGAIMENYVHYFFHDQKRNMTVIDIGVLRYPDMDTPYFKLFHVSIDAWSECRHIGMKDINVNGMTGTFRCQKFQPRKSVVSAVSHETIKKAVVVVENLFN